VGQSTAYQGAGQFDGKYRTYLLRPNGQLTSPGEYGNVIIARPNGQPVYLKDVADVVQSVEDERINRNFWSRQYGEAGTEVVLAVSRQAGANAVEVAQRVKDLLPQFQKHYRECGRSGTHAPHRVHAGCPRYLRFSRSRDGHVYSGGRSPIIDAYHLYRDGRAKFQFE
jgi:hypothetical protein